jgi:hypothetical protein
MAKYLITISRVQVGDSMECGLSVSRLLIAVPYP